MKRTQRNQPISDNAPTTIRALSRDQLPAATGGNWTKPAVTASDDWEAPAQS